MGQVERGAVSPDGQPPKATPNGPEPAGGPPAVPGQLRVAALVVLLEALALVGVAGVLVEKTIAEHPASVGRALFGAALAVFGAVVLAACARGLVRVRPAARTPIVVLELLALPVGYSLGFQAGRIGYGGPMLVAALVVLYLVFTPPARAALDREL